MLSQFMFYVRDIVWNYKLFIQGSTEQIHCSCILFGLIKFLNLKHCLAPVQTLPCHSTYTDKSRRDLQRDLISTNRATRSFLKRCPDSWTAWLPRTAQIYSRCRPPAYANWFLLTVMFPTACTEISSSHSENYAYTCHVSQRLGVFSKLRMEETEARYGQQTRCGPPACDRHEALAVETSMLWPGRVPWNYVSNVNL